MRSMPALVLICLVLAACGGGGADGVEGARGGFVDDFYRVVGTYSFGDPDFAAFSGTGLSAELASSIKPGADAQSHLTAQYVVGGLENRAGTTTELESNASLALDGDGTLRLTGEGIRVHGVGGLDRDADYGVIAQGEAGHGAQLHVFLRPGNAEANDVLGSYHQVFFGRNLLGETSSGLTRTALEAATPFDPPIAKHSVGAFNIDGSVLTTLPFEEAYAVEGGAIMFDIMLQRIGGSVSRDGRVIVVGGGFANNSEPVVRCLIRTSTTASPETVRGTYFFGTMGRAGGTYQSGTGKVTFDGQGGGTYVVTGTDGADSESTGEEPVTYTVAADGALEVQVANGPLILRGAVAEDGRFGALAGSFQQGDITMYVVLVRQ